MHAPTVDAPPVCFDTALAAYREWVGASAHPLDPPARRGRPPRKEKIVVAGDFHVPFHSRPALKALIREESADTDLLIVNGDLGDFWSTSRFPKSKRLVDPCSELRETQAVLTILAERFRKIKILAGNHDGRPHKFLTTVLPPEVLDYIEMTGPGVFHPLQFIAAGLENVEVVEPIRTQNAEFAFLFEYHDLLCTHAETYSKISGKATGNVNQWVHSFAIPAGIVKGSVRVIVQAHTHQSATYLGDFGTLCIEGGCMSTLQDYHGGARIMTPRPMATGWTVIYQHGGHTDFRSSRFIPF